MLILSIIIIPLAGIVLLLLGFTGNNSKKLIQYETNSLQDQIFVANNKTDTKIKTLALTITVINFFVSLVLWFLFDNSSKNFQFIIEQYTIGHYDFYLGLDGLSIYFVLLTTLIAPISIISN